MLMVVDRETKKIWGRFEAWAVDCMDRAEDLVRDLRLRVVDEEVTLMGDMIWWTE